MIKGKYKIFIIFIVSSLFIFLGKVYPQDIKVEYEKLKKEYEKAIADRDNILTQTKYLLEYKTKAQELEAEVKKIQEEKDQIDLKLKEWEEKYSQLEKALQEERAVCQPKISELENQASLLTQERDSLKNSLEKLQIEYKMLPQTKKEISRLQNEKKELISNYNKIDARLKRLEQEKLDLGAEVEIYRRQVKDFKKRYEQALVKNRKLEEKAEQIPVRFAQIARENKILIKETALMHYNLGVFYTKNKEYQRAIAEFEKSIELNPDDPYSHYNLGYIYAEYVLNRPKAIENFRKFLSLVKTKDKDVDWVKKYILTWQTWEGKRPMQ